MTKQGMSVRDIRKKLKFYKNDERKLKYLERLEPKAGIFSEKTRESFYKALASYEINPIKIASYKEKIDSSQKNLEKIGKNLEKEIKNLDNSREEATIEAAKYYIKAGKQEKAREIADKNLEMFLEEKEACVKVMDGYLNSFTEIYKTLGDEGKISSLEKTADSLSTKEDTESLFQSIKLYKKLGKEDNASEVESEWERAVRRENRILEGENLLIEYKLNKANAPWVIGRAASLLNLGPEEIADAYLSHYSFGGCDGKDEAFEFYRRAEAKDKLKKMASRFYDIHDKKQHKPNAVELKDAIRAYDYSNISESTDKKELKKAIEAYTKAGKEEKAMELKRRLKNLKKKRKKR